MSFNFGASTAAKPAATGGFSFGGGAPAAATGTSSFGFGTAAAPATTGTGFGGGAPAATSSFGFGAPPTGTSGFGAPPTGTSGFGAAATAGTSGFGGQQAGGASSLAGATQNAPLGPRTMFVDLPSQLQQQLTGLETAIREQQVLQGEITERTKSHRADEQRRSFDRQIADMQQQLRALWSASARDKNVAERLKDQVLEEFRNSETAARQWHAYQKGIRRTVYLPAVYYWEKYDAFLEHMHRLSREIEELDRHVSAQAQAPRLEGGAGGGAGAQQPTPQALLSVLHAQHDALFAVAAKVADVNAGMEEARDAYRQFRRKYLDDVRDPFRRPDKQKSLLESIDLDAATAAQRQRQSQPQTTAALLAGAHKALGGAAAGGVAGGATQAGAPATGFGAAVLQQQTTVGAAPAAVAIAGFGGAASQPAATAGGFGSAFGAAKPAATGFGAAPGGFGAAPSAAPGGFGAAPAAAAGGFGAAPGATGGFGFGGAAAGAAAGFGGAARSVSFAPSTGFGGPAAAPSVVKKRSPSGNKKKR